MSLVTHVVASLGPATGGPSYTVPALTEALARNGQPVEILSCGLTQPPPAAGVTQRSFARVGAGLPVVGRLAISPGLRGALLAGAGAILHTHGLWQMPPIDAARAAAMRGVPLVVAPRGMLAPPALAYSPRVKRLFGALWQDRALAQAAAFHATAESEYADIRAFGLRQPVAILPNGVDVPDLRPRPGPPARTVLFLGRLHHKKGIDLLLQAWSGVEAEFPDWRLRIVGPDAGGHGAEVLRRIAALGLARATLEPALYGPAKWQAYADAGLFVLPTRSENFGVTVAESLAAGVPVICTRGAPWQGLREHDCGWWVDVDAPALAAALRQAMTLPDGARQAMGLRGRDWVQRAFSWDRIARDTLDFYRWLCNAGEQPHSVRLD
jgi:glycosyltransferase involved in cell wall biosynthesis